MAFKVPTPLWTPNENKPFADLKFLIFRLQIETSTVRRLFWNEPVILNLDQITEIDMTKPPPNFRTTPAGGRLTTTRFNVQQTYTLVDFQWIVFRT
ncbi:hypothetical protein AVEN_271493-1 [Araneus ventricosus]|uniref:Uncharacterized protein n=1 Tax=Araneus ventricosus TaxID=182803 RepID=A0A4Y2U386_ARAVE|nr:hypothetical protein AVEN_271493-1 [Araneus ventricosus]